MTDISPSTRANLKSAIEAATTPLCALDLGHVEGPAERTVTCAHVPASTSALHEPLAAARSIECRASASRQHCAVHADVASEVKELTSHEGHGTPLELPADGLAVLVYAG